MNRLAEIQERLAAIRQELEAPEADLEALEAEIRTLTEEKTAIERRAALVASVINEGPVVRRAPAPADPPAPDTFTAASPEYRTAFLKNLIYEARRKWELGELEDIERRAFTYLTTNTTAVLPTGIQLGIVDMIREKYALLGDLNITGFEGAVEFQQATAIAAGDAAETAENTANSDNLQITIGKVEMTGVEFRASAKIGNKMRIQSIDQFEGWLIDTLSDRIGHVMNDHVVDAISSDVTPTNTWSPATLTDDAMRYSFGLLKGGQGQRVAYANAFTIWNEIAAVEDSYGRPKFIESTVNDDPSVQGRIYGTVVKLDETLTDGQILLGYPAQVKANMFEAPNVESDRDVETRETVFGGYALFEARLGDTRAWVEMNVVAVS